MMDVARADRASHMSIHSMTLHSVPHPTAASLDAGGLRSGLERHHDDCVGWALVCCAFDRSEAGDVLHNSYLKVLDVEAATGITLTESMAMWPGASVSGLYLAHPESQYFVVGRLGRDQVADYAERKGWTLAEAERWLSPNLGYDPED